MNSSYRIYWKMPIKSPHNGICIPLIFSSSAWDWNVNYNKALISICKPAWATTSSTLFDDDPCWLEREVALQQMRLSTDSAELQDINRFFQHIAENLKVLCLVSKILFFFKSDLLTCCVAENPLLMAAFFKAALQQPMCSFRPLNSTGTRCLVVNTVPDKQHWWSKHLCKTFSWIFIHFLQQSTLQSHKPLVP